MQKISVENLSNLLSVCRTLSDQIHLHMIRPYYYLTRTHSKVIQLLDSSTEEVCYKIDNSIIWSSAPIRSHASVLNQENMVWLESCLDSERLCTTWSWRHNVIIVMVSNNLTLIKYSYMSSMLLQNRRSFFLFWNSTNQLT